MQGNSDLIPTSSDRVQSVDRGICCTVVHLHDLWLRNDAYSGGYDIAKGARHGQPRCVCVCQPHPARPHLFPTYPVGLQPPLQFTLTMSVEMQGVLYRHKRRVPCSGMS